MYHAHFRGTHYEAGFRWGSLLSSYHIVLLCQVNFPFHLNLFYLLDGNSLQRKVSPDGKSTKG